MNVYNTCGVTEAKVVWGCKRGEAREADWSWLWKARAESFWGDRVWAALGKYPVVACITDCRGSEPVRSYWNYLGENQQYSWTFALGIVDSSIKARITKSKFLLYTNENAGSDKQTYQFTIKYALTLKDSIWKLPGTVLTRYAIHTSWKNKLQSLDLIKEIMLSVVYHFVISITLREVSIFGRPNTMIVLWHVYSFPSSQMQRLHLTHFCILHSIEQIEAQKMMLNE